MKDPHRILDLPDTATPEEIRERYLQLVRIFHPDRYRQAKDRAFAEARLKEINDAYAVLLQGKRPSNAGQPRLPEPVLWPESIDFGAVAHGQAAQRRVQVGNSGARAESLHFHFGDGQSWFNIVKGQRLNPAQPLPINLDIEANTAHLSPNQTYESWLDVEMDGIRARLPLTLHVVDVATSSPQRPSLSGIVATILVAIGIILVIPLLRSRGPVPSVDPQHASSFPTTATVTIAVNTANAAQMPRAVQEPLVAVVTSTMDADPAPVPDDNSARMVVTPPGTEETDPTVTNETATATPVTTADAQTPAASEIVSATVPPVESITGTTSISPTTVPASVASEPDASSTERIAQETRNDDGNNETSESEADAADEPPRVTVRVPDEFQVNARRLTSVESQSLGLLDKGAVFPAIARTIDSAWVRIILPDGREAWVFTASMDVDTDALATLPVIFTAAPTQIPDAVANTADAPPTAPSAEPATDAQAGARHVVQPGEYLKQLAVSYYGDEELWTLIYGANADRIGPNPDLLTAGTELVIPPAP